MIPWGEVITARDISFTCDYEGDDCYGDSEHCAECNHFVTTYKDVNSYLEK